MKIHNGTSDVQIVGDINSNKVGIDMRNIDFITTILSTNLYSDPIRSLIRETVSNAWDSHIEKGCKDPIIIELKSEFVSEYAKPKYYFRVRDFGVGLTKERFNTIYRNIGSSTKRADNEQIGGWGLGRFSPLSYTDTVYITSYAEGIKTKYIMYKDNNSIKIDEMFSSKLEQDETGLEIFIYVKEEDIEKFCRGLCTELLYFDNIFIDTNIEIKKSNNYYYQISNRIDALRDLKSFNDITFATYNTFKISNGSFISSYNQVTCSILLGNVQYPIKWNLIEGLYNKYRNYPLAIKFNIGELEVTPNREELLYNESNINKINERFGEFEKELNDLIDKNSVDYTSAIEYFYNVYECNNHVLKLDNNISLKIDSSLATYKGVHLEQVVNEDTITKQIRFLLSTIFDSKFSMWSIEDKIYHQNPGSRYFFGVGFAKFWRNKQIVKCDVTKLKPVSKMYLRTHSTYKVCINNHQANLTNTFQYFKDYCKADKRNIIKELEPLFEQFCTEIEQWYTTIDTFDNSNVPEYYINNYKETRKNETTGTIGVNWNSELSIHYQYSEDEYHKAWATKRMKYSDIASNTAGKTVVYGKVSNEMVDKAYCYFNRFLQDQNVIFWKIADTKVKLLEELKLSNFIAIDQFIQLHKNDIINDWTVSNLYNIIPNLHLTCSLYNLDHHQECKNFIAYCVNYCNDHIFYGLKNNYYNHQSLREYFIKLIDPELKPENVYDPIIFKYLKDNDNILKAIQLLSVMDISWSDKNSQAYFLSTLKEKNLLTLNEDEEKLIKENTIFKTL